MGFLSGLATIAGAVGGFAIGGPSGALTGMKLGSGLGSAGEAMFSGGGSKYSGYGGYGGGMGVRSPSNINTGSLSYNNVGGNITMNRSGQPFIPSQGGYASNPFMNTTSLSSPSSSYGNPYAMQTNAMPNPTFMSNLSTAYGDSSGVGQNNVNYDLGNNPFESQFKMDSGSSLLNNTVASGTPAPSQSLPVNMGGMAAQTGGMYGGYQGAPRLAEENDLRMQLYNMNPYVDAMRSNIYGDRQAIQSLVGQTTQLANDANQFRTNFGVNADFTQTNNTLRNLAGEAAGMTGEGYDQYAQATQNAISNLQNVDLSQFDAALQQAQAAGDIQGIEELQQARLAAMGINVDFGQAQQYLQETQQEAQNVMQMVANQELNLSAEQAAVMEQLATSSDVARTLANLDPTQKQALEQLEQAMQGATAAQEQAAGVDINFDSALQGMDTAQQTVDGVEINFGDQLRQIEEARAASTTDEAAFNTLRDEIKSFRNSLSPQYNEALQSSLKAIQAEKQKASGDLRAQMANRRVAGSSFANADIAATEAEYDMREGLVQADFFDKISNATAQAFGLEGQVLDTQIGKRLQSAAQRGALAAEMAGIIDTGITRQLAKGQLQGELSARRADIISTQIGRELEKAGVMGQQAANIVNIAAQTAQTRDMETARELQALGMSAEVAASAAAIASQAAGLKEAEFNARMTKAGVQSNLIGQVRQIAESQAAIESQRLAAEMQKVGLSADIASRIVQATEAQANLDLNKARTYSEIVAQEIDREILKASTEGQLAQMGAGILSEQMSQRLAAISTSGELTAREQAAIGQQASIALQEAAVSGDLFKIENSILQSNATNIGLAMGLNEQEAKAFSMQLSLIQEQANVLRMTTERELQEMNISGNIANGLLSSQAKISAANAELAIKEAEAKGQAQYYGQQALFQGLEAGVDLYTKYKQGQAVEDVAATTKPVEI